MSLDQDYTKHLDKQFNVHGDIPWEIDDDSGADWCLRKIAALERRMETRAEYVQVELARLQSWRAKANKEDEQEIQRFVDLLRGYCKRLNATAQLKGKTHYSLPHGSFGHREAGIPGSDLERTFYVHTRKKETSNMV
jgi:hypothetical protein